MEAIVDEAAVVMDARFRSESSVVPAFNVFREMIWPGELPKPVVHRTPEELGIPRVVADRPEIPVSKLKPDFADCGRRGTMSVKKLKKDAPVHKSATVERLASPSCKPPVDTMAENEKKEECMRVTEEMKRMIREADPDESARVIGERIGLKGATVQYWRE